MVAQTSRDYSLTGKINGRVVALDDDDIEDQVEESWWHPTISRPALKVLMQRSDAPALQADAAGASQALPPATRNRTDLSSGLLERP